MSGSASNGQEGQVSKCYWPWVQDPQHKQDAVLLRGCLCAYGLAMVFGLFYLLWSYKHLETRKYNFCTLCRRSHMIYLKKETSPFYLLPLTAGVNFCWALSFHSAEMILFAFLASGPKGPSTVSSPLGPLYPARAEEMTPWLWRGRAEGHPGICKSSNCTGRRDICK